MNPVIPQSAAEVFRTMFTRRTSAKRQSGTWGSRFRQFSLLLGVTLFFGPIGELQAQTPPAITTQPVDKAVNEGQKATFTVAATGTPIPTFQWQRSISGTWTSISGATAKTYTTAATLPADHGAKFRAVATNSAGTATSATATLTVNYITISTQPKAQTAMAGGTATFSVSATGKPTALTYVWRRKPSGGTAFADIPGATNASFTTATLTSSDNGATYCVVINNGPVSKTSSNAVLTVKSLPVITTQPSNALVNEGQKATFTATVSSTPAATYQWQRLNGSTWTNISGATALSYTTAVTTAADHGRQFRLAAKNANGTTYSSAALLSVNSITITTQPVFSQTVNVEDSAAFGVTATCSIGTLSYQWFRQPHGGTYAPIPGATAASYTIPSTVMEDHGSQFYCQLTAGTYSKNSGTGTLNVSGNPIITSYTADPPIVQQGQQTVLRWAVNRADSLSLSWEPGMRQDVTGLTEFLIGNVDGPIQLVATNSYGIAVQDLTIATLRPAIESFMASNFTPEPGTPITLTAVFSNGSGTIAPGIGTVISGEPVTVIPTDTITYQLTVQNDFGVTSRSTVKIQPTGYIPAKGHFTPVAAMKHPRYWHRTVALLDGRVLAAFGTDPNNAGLNTEIFDPATKSFTDAPAAGLFWRINFPVTLLPSGDAAVWSGVVPGGQANYRVDLFNPNTGKFRTHVPGEIEPDPKWGTSSVLLLNGQVLNTGGEWDVRYCPGGNNSTAYLFDPNAVNAQGEPKPIAVALPWSWKVVNHYSLLLPDGRALIGGGTDGESNYYPRCVMYQPSDGTFEPLAFNPLVLLHSGQVLGYRDEGLGLFDPVSMDFTLLPKERAFPTLLGDATVERALLLPDGKVVLFGCNGYGQQHANYLLDPETGAFAPLAPTALSTRAGAQVTTLPMDGKILITGRTTPEIFDPELPFILSPAFGLIKVGESIAFTAKTEAGAAIPVTWNAAAGSISSSGSWLAPSTPGIYTISATDTQGHKLIAQITVVKPESGFPGIISLSPLNVAVAPGDSIAFRAKASSGIHLHFSATGGDNTPGGDGEWGADGYRTFVYKAGSKPGIYQVRAYLEADPSKVAIAKVTISANASEGMTIVPPTVTLQPGQSQTFNATRTIDGIPTTEGITWCAPSGGTLEDKGNGVAIFTAINTGTFKVTAFSSTPDPRSISASVVSKWPDGPQIQSYAFDRNPIKKGETTLLWWSVTDAITVKINGQVVAASGSMEVTGDQTMRYELKADNSAGSITKFLTLQVTQPLVWKGDCVYAFGQMISEDRPDGAGGIKITYVQSDQVGSPNIVSDSAANLVGSSQNQSFGERFSEDYPNGPDTRPFLRFAGHEEGSESPIHMQSRMYLPAYGRFASPDPVYDQDVNEPSAWNLYVYCMNNPVTRTDPDGMSDAGADGLGVGGDGSANSTITEWMETDPANRLMGNDPNAMAALDLFATGLTRYKEGGFLGRSRKVDLSSLSVKQLDALYIDNYKLLASEVIGTSIGASIGSRYAGALAGPKSGLDTFVPNGQFNESMNLPATSPNAGNALSRKLSALQDAQSGAARVVQLSDGRVIYYSSEVAARNPGPTRGASLVTEYNPSTGQVRQYYESYNHAGGATRVHPKMIDGQTVNSPHFPPTKKELE